MIRKIFTSFTALTNKLLAYFPYSQEKIHLDIRYVDADLGNCGIACVAMLVPNSSIEELIKIYKHPPFYCDPVGWYHDGLVKILGELGYSAQRNSGLTLWKLRSFLKKGQPVIVSLRVPHPDHLSSKEVYGTKDVTLKKEGHLCVLTGFDEKGFYLHDPRNVKGYSKNVFVPYLIFAQIFTGNGVVISF